MHIVHVCSTSLPVPPLGYGGTERLVFWLAREQQKMGLRVTVIAHPDSRVAELLPGVSLLPCDRDRDALALVPADADVLHLHRVPYDGRTPDRPYLVTEHGLRKSGAVYLQNTVYVSRAHARMALEPGGAAGAAGAAAAGASGWRLENLSATNPVVVNGRALAGDGGPGGSVLLRDGDRIEMGEVAFVFHAR